MVDLSGQVLSVSQAVAAVCSASGGAVRLMRQHSDPSRLQLMKDMRAFAQEHQLVVHCQPLRNGWFTAQLVGESPEAVDAVRAAMNYPTGV